MQRYFFLIFCISALSPTLQGDETPESGPEFQLPAIDGSTIRLAKNQGPAIVLFLGTECPLVKLYSPIVQKIANSASKNLRVIGISSNRQDSISDLQTFVKKHGVQFEVAKDYQNRVADQFAATRTPEVFLLDSKLKIVYRGRIDDQYSPGITRANPREHFLRDAVEQLLAGEAITLAQTEPVGCLIGKVRQPMKNSSVTYCQQISRLLQKHCIECHRPGEIGPFSLTDYEEVVGWSDMMLEVIQQNRMPPWHAHPDRGEFLNARHMTTAEKQVFDKWVENGSPYGDQKDLPPAKTFAQGWDLKRRPDQIIEMGRQPYSIPATGIVEYQYFVVDPGFQEDKWVQSAQVLPGNRAIVHHSIVFVRPPDGGRFRGIGWLSAYVPGQRTQKLPEGHARLIPAGSKLVFQQHYTPTGSVQSDLTRIGLTFADEKDVEHEVYTIAGINQEFEIPPMVPDFKVKANVRNLPRHGKLLALAPHMHLRGKSFRAINHQDDSSQILCEVPAYDFNWQHIYTFKKPLELDQIGSLEIEVCFDNSPANPFNPDPKQRVTWGDQTFEEMAVAFFDVSTPRRKAESEAAMPNAAESENTSSPAASDTPKPSARVLEFVDKFFQRWDKNQNNSVEKAETPVALRGFGFWNYDVNRDGRLTRQEVTQAARTRLKNTGD